MHNVFRHRCSAYLQNLVTFTESDSASSRLGSSTTCRSAVTVRTSTKLGGRAFSVSGPTVWNSLPSELRFIDCRVGIHFADSWSHICSRWLLTLLLPVLMHHMYLSNCICKWHVWLRFINLFYQKERMRRNTNHHHHHHYSTDLYSTRVHFCWICKWTWTWNERTCLWWTSINQSVNFYSGLSDRSHFEDH